MLAAAEPGGARAGGTGAAETHFDGIIIEPEEMWVAVVDLGFGAGQVMVHPSWRFYATNVQRLVLSLTTVRNTASHCLRLADSVFQGTYLLGVTN